MCIELKEKHNIHQKVKPIVTLRNTFLALPLVCSALMKNSVSLEMVLCKSLMSINTSNDYEANIQFFTKQLDLNCSICRQRLYMQPGAHNLHLSILRINSFGQNTLMYI